MEWKQDACSFPITQCSLMYYNNNNINNINKYKLTMLAITYSAAVQKHFLCLMKLKEIYILVKYT